MMKDRNQQAPSQKTAEAIVVKMNGILKRMPLSDAVLDWEYNALLQQVHAGERWGVLSDRLKMTKRKIWASVRLVSVDDAEYREMFGWKN